MPEPNLPRSTNGRVVALWCDECRNPTARCSATDCGLRVAQVGPNPVTHEMVDRVAREMASWSGPVPGSVDGFRPYAERALRAAFGTKDVEQ